MSDSADPKAVGMSEQRLQEIEKRAHDSLRPQYLRAPNTYAPFNHTVFYPVPPDDVFDLIAEIRRLQHPTADAALREKVWRAIFGFDSSECEYCVTCKHCSPLYADVALEAAGFTLGEK